MTRPSRQARGRGQGGAEDAGKASAPRAVIDSGVQTFLPLRSRLEAPRAHVEVVPRHTLVSALSRSAAPLVVVSAPAGYGKTLTLVQWVQAERRPTAWLQLDTADNDPVVLLTYLGLTLGELAVVDPALFGWLQEPVTPMKSRILPALEAILAGAKPFLLVLDDAHLVRSKACWEILGFLIDHLPAGAQLVIGSREDPPLPLARMLASGLAEVIRATDLALSRDEARELLRLHGWPVEKDTLDAVLAATEGWAAGVYLALLAGKGRAAEEWLLQIHGDEREIADYLTGEVLERQPYRTQEFLLRTAILERFSAPLCRAVTGRTDAHTALQRLARENLFVTALDEREEWYRYHHLFAECLRAQLARRRPDELSALHRAAAAWHHEHGDPEQAVYHWLAAGDVEPAADLTTSLAEPLLNKGQTETMRRIMAMFSDTQILSHVALTLTAGWVYGMGNPHYVTRRTREKLVRAACATTLITESTDDALLLRATQAFLRAFLAPDGIGRMLADAELSLQAAGSDRASDWYADSCRLRGMALYLAGQPVKAVAPLKLYEEDVPVETDARPVAEALAFQSLIRADQERWEEAEELAERASRSAELAQTEAEPPLAVLLAQARVMTRRDAPALVDHLQRVARFLDEMPNLFEREVILGAVMLGEIALGRDDLVAAERWSVRAHTVLKTYPDAGMLRPRAERLRLALQERRLGLAVTAAEQRVLDLLPTELSVDEIGARLFISRNTMRSHMRSLYTKLGVHSRAEAIRRARALGLLRPSL